MHVLLSVIIAILIVLAVIVTVNMMRGPYLRSAGRKKRTAAVTTSTDSLHIVTAPHVTVCVPARNEERNIDALLGLLCRQSYRYLNILVLDDNSTDATADIVRRHEHEDSRIRLLSGKALPEGWTGKNWACHQLADQAEGSILLFVDADVQPAEAAVEKTVAAMEAYGADAVSTFPQQLLRGVAATAIIPMMDLILYAFLPLPLVYLLRSEALAAANGQWFAFTKDMYRRIGGHSAVRSHIVEDVQLARRVKRYDGRMLLTIGRGSVRCRMYESVPEIREGFSKNFFAAFGFNTPLFLSLLLFLLLIFVVPFFLLFTACIIPASIAVGLILLLRIILSWGTGHGVLTVVLHPIGVLASVLIGLEGIRLRYQHGAVRWKQRSIPVRKAR
ncbi:MAG: glycosyltransferase [Bacteroidetes bacterium]|nr:glycosyltransferase [Bacteroidota bacterium]